VNLNKDVERRKSAADSFAGKAARRYDRLQGCGTDTAGDGDRTDDAGIRTPNGATAWSLIQVQRVLARL